MPSSRRQKTPGRAEEGETHGAVLGCGECAPARSSAAKSGPLLATHRLHRSQMLIDEIMVSQRLCMMSSSMCSFCGLLLLLMAITAGATPEGTMVCLPSNVKAARVEQEP